MEVNKLVLREAVLRALSAENIKNREAEFVISSEAEDTYGTVFKIGGWDLSRYERNPIVCYQHKSNSEDPDMILGTSTVRVEGKLLIGVVRFEAADINAVAEKVWQKVQAGTLRMASVGANILRGHWGDEKLGESADVLYFDNQELLEWSIVSMGSNPDALKREVQTVEEMKTLIARDITVVEEEIVPAETKKRTVREAQLIINQNSY